MVCFNQIINAEELRFPGEIRNGCFCSSDGRRSCCAAQIRYPRENRFVKMSAIALGIVRKIYG